MKSTELCFFNVFLLQIDLTWPRAVQMFEFLKPKALPEYDSLRTNTISAEVRVALCDRQFAEKCFTFSCGCPIDVWFKYVYMYMQLEGLLRRIVLLVPQDNYTGNTIESVTNYIEGTIAQKPALPEGKSMDV